MKGPVYIANGLMCLLAYVINLIIPRKDKADPNTKEFDTANSFDGLVVHQELHVRIRVFLGRNDHGFGLAGICCEMINTKPVMGSINVFLEDREVRFTCDWLV